MTDELHRHAAFLILPSWVHRSDEVSLRDRRARKNRMRARRGGAVGRGAWGSAPLLTLIYLTGWK